MSKRKLTLSIDDKLITAIKHIALDQNKTVSALIENYIKAIKKNKNIIKAIDDINNK